MKNFNINTLATTKTFFTTDVINTEDFLEFLKANQKWIVNNCEENPFFLHQSVFDNSNPEITSQSLSNVKIFSNYFDCFGQPDKEFYGYDLLQKVLATSLQFPVTVVTGSEQLARNISKLDQMKSFSKKEIKVYLINNPDSLSQKSTGYIPRPIVENPQFPTMFTN